ncbi:hypothetical protein [Candidatus Protofrankia datiscae]|uniref:hypothetical protein n=1 Tax=Candidatus Protofrankia datiscae TaxID=2716812 RepID=UPI0010410249|nr:hypothetical protein [Candidatus Protofrankia datiscae]
MSLPIRDLGDHEILSQYGNRYKPLGGPAFRRRPRWGREQAVSVIIGDVTPKQAATTIGLNHRRGDGVRRTVVGRLEAAGFYVRHAPSPMNPDHALVGRHGDWTEDVSRAFDACFDEPEWEDPT